MDINDFIKTLIGYEKIDALDFYIEDDKYHPDQKVFIARIALLEEEQFRCPICGQKCAKYDRLRDVKRWRSLDLGKNHGYFTDYYRLVIKHLVC